MSLVVDRRFGELARAEPIADSPGRVIWFGAFAAFALLAGLLFWAKFAVISSAAVASGYVSVEGNRRAVQHRDGGPVAAVLVREGDLVKKGQTLVKLDLSEVRADVDVLHTTRLQLLARLARLRAEAANAAEIVYSDELLAAGRAQPAIMSFLDQERSIFQTRRVSYLGQLSLLKQQIEGYRRQLEGLRGQVASKHAQVGSIDKEHQDLAGLLAKGYVQRPRVLALERASMALRGDLEGLTAAIASAQNEIRKIELQISQLDKDRQEDISKTWSDAESRLAETEPRLIASRERLSRADLVAPENGYVYALAVHSAGAALIPGQTVLEIVPADEGLVITVEVDPRDVDRVHPGQPVEVHLLPYKDRYMSIIDGTVTKVSADRIQEQATARVFYKAIVSVDRESLRRNGVELVPGMPATAAIRTGERTILAFLLDPVFHIYDFAMKEK